MRREGMCELRYMCLKVRDLNTAVSRYESADVRSQTSKSLLT